MRERDTTLHLILMLALTFTTGIIDAIGYLGLDKIFAGNMTGNVVILSMALARADNLPWLGPLLALAAFMTGAAIGGRVLRPVPIGWSSRTTCTLAIVGSVLALLSLTLFITRGTPSHPWQYVITIGLAAAMGIQAAAARHIAVRDVTTVVVTSTITGLAADSRLAAGATQLWKRRAFAIALIALGALAGALLLTIHIALGVAVAASIVLIATAAGHLGRPHPKPDKNRD